MYSIEKLKNDLLALGVKKGDTILVRADLGTVGKLETKKREDYINFMLDAVGEEGTIVGLSFTSGFFIKKKNSPIFDGTNKSNTGAFANIMLSHPKAKRSNHPTNSFVAIGKYADYIVGDHDENSGAYEPIRKIIELGGKMILLGCVGTSPGFTTTHLAEVDLGLHKRIIFPSLNGAYYKRNGEIKLFKRKDLGSCSFSFYHFYAYYIKYELLYQGYVGNAYSIMIDAKKAFDLEKKILTNNPKITLCNRPNCMMCRARRWDNLIDFPKYFFNVGVKKLYNFMKSRNK
ncbi:MAG: AAC(3) family N-acetyltransferase [Arcobacteraceae bacterium]|jgi:aminoglycoside N3'-acetyltransferase|nr:AAC(3) family N-acetyltransferase [Arcobacteraceae bacterium]